MTEYPNMSKSDSTQKTTNSSTSNGREACSQNNEQMCNTDTRLTASYSTVFANISSSLVSMRWCPTSEDRLAEAESNLLKHLTRPFKTYFVDIGEGWGCKVNNIRTLEMIVDHKQDSEKNIESKHPLVMVHGFAAGIGTWILNLDKLSSTVERKIYAIDVIGFARSSRAPFDLTGDVEGQFVDSIERWRAKVGIDKFILLGHSFGGYLCASYALRHPERVPHVILADPWGVQDRKASPNHGTYRFPFWVRAITSVLQAFNPLAVLRMSGPYGPSLVHKLRGDLREKFRPILSDDCDKFLDYIYHCNTQVATGETAFKALALPYGWPKNPLINRLVDLDESVSLTFIYGSRSWIEKAPGELLRDCLTSDRVVVNEIEGSGHHVYADKYEEFNELVKEACKKVPN